jgi:hypothetical protein
MPSKRWFSNELPMQTVLMCALQYGRDGECRAALVDTGAEK